MTSTSATTSTVQGLDTGTWEIDPAHTEIAFTVRHLMSRVRGVFHEFEGRVHIADEVLDSRAEASIQLSSVDTGAAQRDEHLRSSDFFDVDTKPVMTFASTALRSRDDDYVLTGDLTVNDVTRPVDLTVELLGTEVDGYGRTVAGFTASGEINRKDFGVDWNMPLEGGRLLVGDKVTLTLTVQATKQS